MTDAAVDCAWCPGFVPATGPLTTSHTICPTCYQRVMADDDEAARPHTSNDCDEHCHGCPACYQRTGETVCDRLCPHAEPDDAVDGDPVDFHE